MDDQPYLTNEVLVQALQERYALNPTGLELLQAGYDFYAQVYRVAAGRGQGYFLKVKSGPVAEASLLVPHFLKEQGLEQVVAPLLTLQQDLYAKVEDFSLLLYPFIKGRSAWKGNLSDSHWVAYGAFLKKLHSLQLPPGLLQRLPKETFLPPQKTLHFMKQLQASVLTQAYADPFQVELAAFWKERHSEIGQLIDRSEQLSRRLRSHAFDPVLCHSDIHTANLLLDEQGSLYVVDWDQPILAPRELDLMFVTLGSFVTEEKDEALFFEGYGSVEIDPILMTYYRCTRTVDDLGEFAMQVFLKDTTPETKADSIYWFKAHFVSGGE